MGHDATQMWSRSGIMLQPARRRQKMLHRDGSECRILAVDVVIANAAGFAYVDHVDADHASAS